MDPQDKEDKLTRLCTDMTWVKMTLSNHLQHHQKLAVGLVLGLLGVIGSLIAILVSN